MLSVSHVPQKIFHRVVTCQGQKSNQLQHSRDLATAEHRDSNFKATRRRTLFSVSTALISSISQREDFAEAADSEETISSSQKVFLDIDVDRKPFGRVEIEICSDVPIGGQRFLDLAVGKEGVRYKATKFIRLTPSFVVNGGVKSLSLTENMESPIAGGDSLQGLLKELDKQQHRHDESGVVSLVVKSTNIRPVKKKLVAMNGKLQTVEEGGSIGPNGTGFVITTALSPELDDTNLVVGRVLSGMDVIERLSQLPIVKDNKGSPFYQAAKKFGDPRAVIAEMSFGKPFNRIVVSSSGAL